MSDNQEYVALQPIDHAGVRAYNPGDRVPVDNVKTHGYEVGVQVALADTKEARAVTSPADAEQSGAEDSKATTDQPGDEQGAAQQAATAGTPTAKPAKASGSK